MTSNLNARALLWISFTSMIGSGWLFGALYSAHLAGPSAILAWPIAGILLIVVALCFAEIATMFPKANILILLPSYTHGHLTSVIMGGFAWLSLASIPVIETQGLVQYASNYIPHLMVQEGTRYLFTFFGYGVAVVILASFVVLNYFGIRLFARINEGFTIWKIVIPLLTIIALFKMHFSVHNFYAFGGFMPYGWHGMMQAMSSGGILFSLLGFRQVIIMMHETSDPQKIVPRVLIISLVSTTLLYTALQAVFIGSLDTKDLAGGFANLTFPGDAGPFAALATMAGLTWLSYILYIDAFVSPFSTAFVYSTTAAQMLGSMAEVGDAPKKLAEKNKYLIPYVSLFFNFILGLILFFLLRSWQEMAAFSVATVMLTYGVGPICLVALRQQLPDYRRPFRLYGGPWIAFLGFYICTAGVYWAGLHSVIRLLILMTIGMTFYFFYQKFLSTHKKRLDAKNAWWILVYLLALAVFSLCGNYGGKHLLPAYWDMLYLMGLCLGIFMLALYSKKHQISGLD
jgi:amino acid transporter